MALLFPRAGRAKRFEHKPIYWNPQKEALDRRIESIRKELIQDGTLAQGSTTQGNESLYSAAEQERQAALRRSSIGAFIEGSALEQERTEELHNAFVGGTKHLRRQQERGIEGHARTKVMARTLLFLLLLGLLAWLFYFKG